MQENKIISLEDRVPVLRNKKRKKANLRLLVTILVFFSLLLCVLYFQTSIGSKIHLVINGNQLYSDKEIQKLADVSVDDSFLTIRSKRVVDQLESQNTIQSAIVHKRFPNKVEIDVKEFQPVGQGLFSGKKYLLLESGVLIKEKNSLGNTTAPDLIGWKQGDELQEMAAELKKMPQSIFQSISEIDYTPSKDDPLLITVFTNEGYEVRTTIRKFSNKMSNYPLILKSIPKDQKGVIHLEVGAYFSPYSTDPK
ncbi:FtsQ-type POTRA domain-containing protein [Bacillus sp. AFS053548]|uniref:cell division protein FtsQ/DivIB n=1 Tax=Bacillus sp. AFS053548 TaxID=2033505 RepID=UPI000BFD696C|nr:FtsQ-type POTRA domain-containing protein [Bacillus sp. AFS053548]PGM54854.1 cell division protein FtsQ [Bacillus sp. AFS053548]